jgi:hypothetical protein
MHADTATDAVTAAAITATPTAAVPNRAAGAPPDGNAYAAALSATIRAQQWSEGLQLIANMQSGDSPATAIDCNSDSSSDSGSDAASSDGSDSKTARLLRHNMYTLAAAVGVCAGTGDWEQASEVTIIMFTILNTCSC